MSLFSLFTSRKEQIYCDKSSSSARKAFTLRGQKVVLETDGAEMLWMRKGYRERFDILEPNQLINHFPGETAIINKGYLTETLKRQDQSWGHKGGLLMSEFYPESYCLYKPDERKAFFDKMPLVDDRENLWIYKPGNNSRGRGIEILWRFNTLRRKYKKYGDRPIKKKDEQAIIQRYIQKPLLLEGRKSEIRVYWLVASIDPLMVLLYPEATVRLNSLPYRLDDFDNQLVHVTNVYQQKNHPDYDPNVVLKWPFEKLGRYISEELKLAEPDFLQRHLIPRIRQILGTVATASKESLAANYPEQGDCFAVFGADMILDSELRPWLSEVQKGPGLSFDDAVKRNVIPPMLSEAANIAFEVRRRRIKGKSLKDLATPQKYQWVVNELDPELVQSEPGGFYSAVNPQNA